MEISAIDQEVSDYDWFAVDKEGNVGCFASGGGILPRSVAESAEDLKLLVNYFQALKAEESNYCLATAFNFPKDIVTDKQREYFLSSYAYYSARGLYSFDRNQLDRRGRAEAFEYGPITVPTNPLSIGQLPIEIQQIIMKTQCKGVFDTGQIVSLFQFQDFSL